MNRVSTQLLEISEHLVFAENQELWVIKNKSGSFLQSFFLSKNQVNPSDDR